MGKHHHAFFRGRRFSIAERYDLSPRDSRLNRFWHWLADRLGGTTAAEEAATA